MSTKNTKDDTNGIGEPTIIAMIIIWIIIEILGTYCNIHKEEFREKERKEFEEWHNEIMTTGGNIHWDD